MLRTNVVGTTAPPGSGAQRCAQAGEREHRIDSMAGTAATAARSSRATTLADAFGTRSQQFVYSMLNGLGKATEDRSLDYNFSPGSPNQLAFNAALAVIDGVRPKDEIEAMLAAHMAV